MNDSPLSLNLTKNIELVTKEYLPKWKEMEALFDKLLAFNDCEAWDKIASLVENDVIYPYRMYIDEPFALVFCAAVYRSEKQAGGHSIFENVYSLKQLLVKLKKVQFYIERLEYNIPVNDDDLAEFKELNPSGVLLSAIADNYVLNDNDRERVKKALGIYA